MIIAAEFPFNNGGSIRNTHPLLVQEVEDVIAGVNASLYKSKVSKEKRTRGNLLYDPKGLNKAFKAGFASRGWEEKKKVSCQYPTKYYRPGYQPKKLRKSSREMDFLKDRLGVEVQFGKYSFMVYNVCAKMTIFSNLGLIDVGIEIVPMKSFAGEMSSGVSYFEQFAWDLEKRGVADIDIPVLIFGIDA